MTECVLAGLAVLFTVAPGCIPYEICYGKCVVPVSWAVAIILLAICVVI